MGKMRPTWEHLWVMVSNCRINMPDERTASRGGRNTLVLTPAADAHGAQRYLDRWVGREAVSPESVVSVTYSQSPDEWLRNRPGGVGDRTRRTLVRVDDFCRGTASATPTGPIAAGGEVVVSTVADPTDLGELHGTLQRHLERPTDEDGRAVLGFESVTALLGHVTSDDARTFLRDLIALVNRVDGDAFYLLDPTVHSPTTLVSLLPLFDAVELDSAAEDDSAATADGDPAVQEAATNGTPTAIEPGEEPTEIPSAEETSEIEDVMVEDVEDVGVVADTEPRGKADGGERRDGPEDEGEGTEEPVPNAEEETSTIDVVDVDPKRGHDVLRSERRRRVLYALLQAPEGMEVRTLADRIAAAEDDSTTDEVRVGLAHVDLPKLEDEGFVERVDDELLRATDSARSLLPYLRLDAVSDGVDPDDLD